jgi:hypothetical protein
VQCNYQAPDDATLTYAFNVDPYAVTEPVAKDAATGEVLPFTVVEDGKRVMFRSQDVYEGRVVDVRYTAAVADERRLTLDAGIVAGTLTVARGENQVCTAESGAIALDGRTLSLGDACFPYERLEVRYKAITAVRRAFRFSEADMSALRKRAGGGEVAFSVAIDGTALEEGWSITSDGLGVELDSAPALRAGTAESPEVTVRAQIAVGEKL